MKPDVVVSLEAMISLMDHLKEFPKCNARDFLFGRGEHGSITAARSVLNDPPVSQCLEALRSLDARLRACMKDPISAAEAYDSFYQEMVAEALADNALNVMAYKRKAAMLRGQA